MALPQLLLPEGTPPFLRDTHELELIPLYANTQPQTGAAIRRRLWVSAPRYASVCLELSTPQMEAFDSWFEGPIQAGSVKFSAQIQNQGPGLLWWSCRFLEPYTTEYLGGLWWKVNAKLMLFDDGSVTAPVPTGLVGGAYLGLQATANLIVEQPISGSVVIALELNPKITALSGSVLLAALYGSYLPPAAIGSAAGASLMLGVREAEKIAAAVGASNVQGVGISLRTASAFAAGSAVVFGSGINTIGSASATGTAIALGVSLGGASALLLETGVDRLLLEDGTSRLLLE